MKQYIDKNAVVAEIERRKQTWQHQDQQYVNGGKDVCDYLLGFIDTLEVKEVDLENFVKGRIDYPLLGYDFPNIYPNYKELKFYCDKNGIKDEDEVKIIIIKDGIL